jgi:hypothetical protein
MTTPRLDDLIDGIRAQHPDRPLEQLTTAVMTADRMNDIADHLIGHFVDQARRSGASWTEIGGCIGVTKQAAQQRFTPKSDPNIFARFTHPARALITTAQQEALAGRQTEILPEHLLIGLLGGSESAALQVLAQLGVEVAAVRAAAESALPPAGAGQPTVAPFSGAAKKVLERTAREAARLGDDVIGTQHVLLALLTEAPSALAALDAAAAETAVRTLPESAMDKPLGR